MPQFNVTLPAAAIEQMNEAASHLDVQRSGSGFELTLEVALLAERLKVNPHMYQLVGGDFRKVELGKFNYLAFYRISGQDVSSSRFRSSARLASTLFQSDRNRRPSVCQRFYWCHLRNTTSLNPETSETENCWQDVEIILL